uniref:50S ribosomal protein L14 n=1 Tax=Lygus hesperus TaxID=30085 RepID=A0A0A9Z591_LYGHE
MTITTGKNFPKWCFRRVQKAITAAIVCTTADENSAHRKISYHISGKVTRSSRVVTSRKDATPSPPISQANFSRVITNLRRSSCPPSSDEKAFETGSEEWFHIKSWRDKNHFCHHSPLGRLGTHQRTNRGFFFIDLLTSRFRNEQLLSVRSGY